MPTQKFEWICQPFSALSPSTLYAILQARCAVFVVEQRCAYQDIDGRDLDPRALHVLARDSKGEVQAYLRVLPPGLAFAEPSLGRVLTIPTTRGTRLGEQLVVHGLDALLERWPGRSVRIGAQKYLVRFYRKFGFEVASEVYLEDDIPHVEMLRRP